MKALFVFLGLFFGLYIGFYITPLFSFLIALLSLLSIFVAFKKQKLKFFLFSFIVGALLSFSFYLPLLNKNECIVLICQTRNNYVIGKTLFHKFYIYDSINYEVGDIVKMKGKISSFSFAEYESKFSFSSYLISLGARNEFKIDSSSYLFKNPIRFRLIEKAFLSSFSNEEKSLIELILFNKKDYQDELIKKIDSLSLLYLLSNSGLFYSLMLKLNKTIFSSFLSGKKEDVAEIILGSFLFLFSFKKIGVIRSFFSFLLRKIFKLKKKKVDDLTLICLPGLLLLAFDFNFAYQDGFFLSMGIALLYYFTNVKFSFYKKKKRLFLEFLLLNVFILPFKLSFSSGQFHLFSYFYSFLLTPIVAFSYFVCLFSFTFFRLGNFVSFLYEIILKLSNLFLKFDPTLSLFTPCKTSIIIFYIFFFIWLIFFNLNEIKIRRIASFSYIFSLLISFLPFWNYFSNEVCFINVGQGDSILLRNQNKTVLIDTGGNIKFDMAKEVLIPFFRKKRIYKIDYLILTHGDFDHDGAKESLCKNFNVKKVVDSKYEFPIEVGDLTLENLNRYNLEGNNENSLAIYTEFIDKKWLFMGDCPLEIEKLIIKDCPNLEADVLKVGHHGSITSTCYEFLKAIKPKEAIISVGKNNSYGHPDSKVISRLKSENIKVRRTDIEGSISYFSFAK